MVFERDRIDHEPDGHTFDRARERPTVLWNAKPEGDNLGSVLRARRYVPTPPESTGIDTIHLLEMYTLLFIRAVQI
jgi:hypothetical protein